MRYISIAQVHGAYTRVTPKHFFYLGIMLNLGIMLTTYKYNRHQLKLFMFLFFT